MAETNFQFTVNVPVRMRITDVTVWPNKPYQDKMLPPQVSIKAKLPDGSEIKSYLKVPSWKVLKSLHESGVIGPYEESAASDTVSSRISLRVIAQDRIVTLAKPAGQKYEALVFQSPDGPAKAATHARTAQPASQAPKGSFEAMMDDSGDPGPEVPPELRRSAHEAVTPEELSEADRLNLERRGRIFNLSCETWAACAAFQVAEGKKHGFPVDGASVNAMAANLMITYDKRNIL